MTTRMERRRPSGKDSSSTPLASKPAAPSHSSAAVQGELHQSPGTIVAFEAARRLQARGRTPVRVFA
ncbi:hypothetical protein [Streptomyces sp. SLBN-8D4]|uniref:hypothetical protein n=1 Tax=Streptomyces sp. SLBN-8D4 TaxID=3377728 RepID=UPI003C7E2D99